MMKHGSLISMVLATLLGWSSWLLVMHKMSPFTTGYLALGLFYASLVMALSGSFALLIHYLRLWATPKNEMVNLNVALREGFLLAVMSSVGLVFQRLKVLTWWDALLLLIIIFLIEFYVLSRD